MSDRGLRYWLTWPHTRSDHVVAFVVFFALTLAFGATEATIASLLAAAATLLLGVRLLAWNAEEVLEEDGELQE